ncbi:MAG: hypothetical protein ICV55_02990 [Coleofasciculus sp. C3-bin4]|nr:hypothetical protein [Coleofasciculus sp. C3-bin4]
MPVDLATFFRVIYLNEGVWGSYSATSIPYGLGVGFRERQLRAERGSAERSQSLPHAEVRTVHGLPQANSRDSMSLELAFYRITKYG